MNVWAGNQKKSAKQIFSDKQFLSAKQLYEIKPPEVWAIIALSNTYQFFSTSVRKFMLLGSVQELGAQRR